MASHSDPWYVEFFKRDYLPSYDHTFTRERVEREVALVERALGLRPGHRVLDLCCGPRRHAVALARHGIRVTGQDLNASYFDMVHETAEAEGLPLETVQSDMRRIPFEAEFDNVINMFTSFGYLETEDDDQEVLRQVARALKPSGRFLLDTVNREWVVSNYIQNEWREDPDGTVYLEHRNLDLLTSRNHVSFTVVAPDGTRRESVGHKARLYTLTEMARMLANAGLALEHTYGGFEGEPYGVATRRMILVARKGE